MKKSKFSDTQIVSILKQAEAGMPVREVCRFECFRASAQSGTGTTSLSSAASCGGEPATSISALWPGCCLVSRSLPAQGRPRMRRNWPAPSSVLAPVVFPDSAYACARKRENPSAKLHRDYSIRPPKNHDCPHPLCPQPDRRSPSGQCAHGLVLLAVCSAPRRQVRAAD